MRFAQVLAPPRIAQNKQHFRPQRRFERVFVKGSIDNIC